MTFGQTFDPSDVGVVGLLVLLESALSVDNAVVLAVMASRLAPRNAAAALRYGLAASFVLRAVAVAAAAYIIRYPILKLAAAAYLAYLAARRFFFGNKRPFKDGREQQPMPLWQGVVAIELTDMTFAIDNVLAAVALVGPPPPGASINQLHPKFWVIMTGGMLGVILSRFAATTCLKLLRQFPRLEPCAYLMVLWIACKLAFEWAGCDFHDPHQVWLWLFWIGLGACAAAGFIPGQKTGAIKPAD